MKRLVCELCGGVDLVKSGDFFVCQSCGVKYTEEAARKILDININMSGYSKRQIENFMELASKALTSGNWNEALRYSQNILENDTGDYKAWLIKGAATGCLNAINGNYNLSECVSCLTTAISCAPEEHRTEAVESAVTNIESVLVLYGNLLDGRFYIYSIRNDMNSLNALLKQYYSLCEPLLTQYDPARRDSSASGFASKINNVASRMWNEVIPNLPRIGERMTIDSQNFNDAFNEATVIIEMLNAAVNLGRSDAAGTATRSRNLIEVHDALISALSLSYDNIRGEYVAKPGQNIDVIKRLVNDVMRIHEDLKKLDPKHRVPSKSRYFVKRQIGCSVLVLIGVIMMFLLIVMMEIIAAR